MPEQSITPDTYDLLAKFKAGWFGEKPNTSLNTYSYDFEHIREHAAEGTVIVDGSDLDYEVVCKLAISGPMRDLALAPNTCKRGLFDPKVESAEGILYEAFRPLDYVSLDIWLAECRRLGARVGIYQNAQIVWE